MAINLHSAKFLRPCYPRPSPLECLEAGRGTGREGGREGEREEERVRIALFFCSTKEAIERVAYEYCQDLQRQHVLYFECRYNPMSPHMSPEEYIEGATAGLMRGERDFGVKSRQILDFMRDSPGTLENSHLQEIISFLPSLSSSLLPSPLSLPPSLPPSFPPSSRKRGQDS